MKKEATISKRVRELKEVESEDEERIQGRASEAFGSAAGNDNYKFACLNRAPSVSRWQHWFPIMTVESAVQTKTTGIRAAI